MTSLLWIIYVLAYGTATTTWIDAAQSTCGGTLTATRGIIQTPHFPYKFDVPISCIWIIDASEVPTTNVSIVVYFTQQYVLSGLKFTEYDYYSEGYQIKSQQEPFEFNEDTVTKIAYLRFSSKYLEIKFTMTSLHGTHLRALDKLLDVYGFNITYEVDDVKPYQCNALKCRFLGHCYAAQDYSSYYCSCFPGFIGDDCGLGPLCLEGKKNFCENGGTCKHIGDTAVTCLCPNGFKGNKCELPDLKDNSGCSQTDTDCDSECEFSIQEPNTCKCIQSTKNKKKDLVRYEATIRLANNALQSLSDNGDISINDNVISFLQKQISRTFRNSNLTITNDLEIHRIMKTNIAFRFVGSKKDEYKMREIIKKMAERGRIGNITLISTFFEFRQEAALQLQSVIVNQNSDVREDTEFILSCQAQGSPRMVFRWFKNEVYINTTKATRKIWTRVFENNSSRHHYTALLGVAKASRLDEGIYTCQVSDFGMQQCRSTTIYVLAKPELRVDPPSATLYRGESLRIRCISPSRDQRYGKLGYSWTKNNALFQLDSEIEMWEDLYPEGSILKINNIQKSGNYTCTSYNRAGRISKSVYVHVVDRGVVELCSNDTSYGVRWPPSSPGSPILAECPKRYEGESIRICEQRDFGKPIWLMPDFSNCISDFLVDVNNEFRGLTFGYQKTNGSAVLKSCLEYALNRHTDFLPGEAGFLLGLLQEIYEYLQQKGTQTEQELTSDIILQILDIVLKSEHSLNNQQQVKQLQTLVQSAALNRELIASQVPVPVPSTSLQYHQMSSFRVHRQHITTLPFYSQIYGDHLFSDQLFVKIAMDSHLESISTNGTIMLTVVSYKNLTNYLPKMYFERKNFGPDVDYMVASRIIASWLFYANRSNQFAQPIPLHLPLETAHVEIIFQHQSSPIAEWMPICGNASQATFEATWQTDHCFTENLMENITKCICPASGTFAVLLARKTFNASIIRISSPPMFVVVSCGCCFLQSCIAFVILLPILYSQKCSVTFLKMQFCTATSTAMAIFTLGLLKLLPQDWHGIISSSLAGLLLLGSSTLVGITLIVESELHNRKSSTANLATGMRGAIGLSWFLPVLYAVSTPLVYTVMGHWPNNWWLEIRSFGFILFVIIELLFVILFCLLFFTIFRKLLYLAKKHDKHNASILRRITLLYQTATILALKLTTDSLYLIYLNSNEYIINYVFGVASVILGFLILFCFVVKAEVRLKTNNLDQKLTKNSIEEYCSGSINSPLSFYSNQDTEKDNDSAPPTTKLPVTILNVSRCPLDRLPVVGELGEAAFMELEDHHRVALDNKFCGFGVVATPVKCELYDSYKSKPVENFLNGNSDFVGVGSLDILQGVSQDSIIGIRVSTCGDKLISEQKIAPSPELQTLKSPPKLQHQQQHQIPSQLKQQPSQISTASTLSCSPSSATQAPPTITITTSEEDDSEPIDGMLDRISHDLDYLLNRTVEVPVVRRSPATNATSSSSSSSSSSSTQSVLTSFSPAKGTHSSSTSSSAAAASTIISSPPSLSVHEVIIEESEE